MEPEPLYMTLGEHTWVDSGLVAGHSGESFSFTITNDQPSRFHRFVFSGRLPRKTKKAVKRSLVSRRGVLTHSQRRRVARAIALSRFEHLSSGQS